MKRFSRTSVILWLFLLLTACVKSSPNATHHPNTQKELVRDPQHPPSVDKTEESELPADLSAGPLPSNDTEAFNWAMKYAEQALAAEAQQYTKAYQYYQNSVAMLEHLELRYPDSDHLKTVKQRLEAADEIEHSLFKERLLK